MVTFADPSTRRERAQPAERYRACVRDVRHGLAYRVELFEDRFALLDLLVRSGRYELASVSPIRSSSADDFDEGRTGDLQRRRDNSSRLA